jgi:hypothetical protein
MLGAIEGSRFNDFAFWHGIEGRIEAAIGAKAADLLPQSQEVISQVIGSQVIGSQVIGSQVIGSPAIANSGIANPAPAIATPALAETPQVSTDNAEAAQ